MTTKYDDLIKVSAQNAGIDPDLFRAQLVQESGLNPEAVSPAGALGIGQIMPKYWLGKHGLATEADIRNPEKAVQAAAQRLGSKRALHRFPHFTDRRQLSG